MRFVLPLVLGLASFAAPHQDSAPARVQPGASPAQPMHTLFEAHCAGCHAGEDSAGDLDLEAWLERADAGADTAVLRRLRAVLREGRMPPPRRSPPSREELAPALEWLEAGLERGIERLPEPPPVPLRRLNAAEYQASVLDLFGVDFDARAHFPADGVAEGFDTLGDALTLSDALLEKYLLAAERIALEAVTGPEPDAARSVRAGPSELRGPEEFRRDWGWALFSNGEAQFGIEVARSAEYVLRVGAFAQQAGPEPARMELRVDGTAVARVDVLAARDAPGVYETRVKLQRGERRLGAAFVNDFYAPEAEDQSARDRNLYVLWMELAGPVAGALPTAFQARFLGDDAAADPRASLELLARRVWRRPPAPEDLRRLLELSDEEDPWPERLRLAITALLCSPRFLFRDEPQEGPRALDGHELATRLAAFLWSSTPDDELLRLAADGGLSEDEVLTGQVERMLRDPRASSLARRFAVQWLQLEALEEHRPDPDLFPDFDERLRASMRAETELFFEAVLREGRPVCELLDADFTFVDERLARHYGFPGVRGEHMRRVRLDEAQRARRGGLLGHAAVLAVTSTPTRTSPVKRGKFVLEALLGAPPPPPPPASDSFDESPEAAARASLRERLEAHREAPACAVCHARMDPLGFALEAFDPVGALRDTADGFPVDDLGQLPDGRELRGIEGLRALLMDDPDFVRTLASKLMTFALGRALVESDQLVLDRLAVELEPRDPTLADLVRAVVLAPSFRRTGGERAP